MDAARDGAPPSAPTATPMADAPRSTLHWVVLLLMALAGAVVEMTLTAPRGPGVSTDAVEYIAAADSVARGAGFVSFTGGPFVSFGPLYPLVLAVPRVLFGVDPLVTARVLSALSLSAIVLLTGLLFWDIMRSSKWWGVLAALSTLVSSSFLVLCGNVFSDPLFIVLVLLFLLIARRYLRDRSPWALLSTLAVCALAALTRYVGVTLIAPGAVMILYSHRQSPRKVIWGTALFAGLSVAPLSIWLLRNTLVVGMPFGYRNPTEWLPLQNVSDISTKVSRWFIPQEIPLPGLLWLALGVLMMGLAWRRAPDLKGVLRSLVAAEPAVHTIGGFILAYSVTLLFTVQASDHIGLAYDDRYYLPLYVPLLLLLCLVARRVVSPMLPRRLGLKRESVVMVAFAVWLVYPGLVGARLVRRTAIRAWIPYYNIYQSPLFMDSEVTRWLQEGVARGYALIYSNQSAAAYLALRRPIEPSPLNRDRYGNPLPLETYRGVWPRGEDALLLWYEARKDTAFPLEDLAKLADLEPLRTSEQAGIYIVHIR